MELDGRLDKSEWSNAIWTDLFVDIEGPMRKPNPPTSTRVKMMWDDNYLYVGAHMEEPRVWGTFTEKNTVMYHENDFEIFIDPDASRHNYYEFEMNCLNTIWELLLHRPYKDGHSIENPYNLNDIHSAVYIDGVPNDPSVRCKIWSVEVALPLAEMIQFDDLRKRKVQAGDTWRMNFSRVHYDLDIENGQYVKVPNQREYNFVWAPTGIIDIHRPEKWAHVVFLGSSTLDMNEWIQWSEKLDKEDIMENILNKVYYDQRNYHSTHSHYATSLELLYGNTIPFQYPVNLMMDRNNQSYIAIIETNDGRKRSMRNDARYTIETSDD